MIDLYHLQIKEFPGLGINLIYNL